MQVKHNRRTAKNSLKGVGLKDFVYRQYERQGR